MHLYTDEGDIDTTANHPFYVIDKGWVAAGDLVEGDEVYNLDGTTTTVTGYEVEKLDEPVLVYNLEVEDFHSYFVGCVPVLVHNYSNDSKARKKSPKDINFSQDTINKDFDTPTGKVSIQKVIRQGPSQVKDFPPIKVLNVKGQLVVRDGNSRLYVARKTKAENIKYIVENSPEDWIDLYDRLKRSGYKSTGSNQLPKPK